MNQILFSFVISFAPSFNAFFTADAVYKSLLCKGEHQQRRQNDDRAGHHDQGPVGAVSVAFNEECAQLLGDHVFRRIVGNQGHSI